MGVTDTIEVDIAAVGRIDAVQKILRVVCDATGMGFAAVARVTPDRWVACAVDDRIRFGLTAGGELPITTTICDEIRNTGRAVIIDHVDSDPHWRAHPTPRQYGFQSYISVPIHFRGEFFGTLCAIDPNPAKLNNPQTIGMFELFADLIGEQLDGQARLATSEAALMDAQAVGELRDQFIAVLGHDLKNPLAAVDGGARILLRGGLDEGARTIVGLMQGSVRRMNGLIDNVLDFARGRLGGGFDIERRHEAGLAGMLEQVVLEMRTANPERVIVSDIALDEAVDCDSRRVAQLFSNLLSNAFSHGDETTPVGVSARTQGGVFTLAVSNEGEPIPEGAMGQLFQPFSRAAIGPHRAGLGLGLYIASEIARAHGGTLDVESNEALTTFTFRMACGPEA
jgi:signal transduction histidine kinase